MELPMQYDEAVGLIESHRGKCLNIGTSANAPSTNRIIQAENRLGVQLPPSYKWFLNNYGGGEVGGEEIFSLYEMEGAVGGDLAYIYSTMRTKALIESYEIPIMLTSLGELFVFDVSVQQIEYPVCLKLADENQHYADNFVDFLCKIIPFFCGGASNPD